MSPRSTAAAAFQIMLVSTEADWTLSSDNKASQLKWAKAKIERLLYRAMDVMQAEAAQLPHCADYLMREDLDPTMADA